MNIFLRQAVREQGIPFKITAAPYLKGSPKLLNEINAYSDYDSYVIHKLKESEAKVADGTMNYYAQDDVFSGAEEIISNAEDKNNL